MLPNIIDEFDGELWINYENGVCNVNISIQIPELNIEKKEELIAVAKNKKNARAVGIVGKIRDAVENFFLDEWNTGAMAMPSGTIGLGTGYSEGVDYTYLWRLEEYRSNIKKEEQTEAWDELEKSIIASVADDVIVGVKGKCAEIVIIKRFA